ncbi:uncharacterized protein LOC126584190 [Malus sylvestris]|uniref:uncharacterized protein LOC126584190 n=1 Tax=Malus sylvestris TaxID=3752 RepID=UPI0021AC0419|nr:uncharacterized protein LOC126584190 [Malus sylvestris]
MTSASTTNALGSQPEKYSGTLSPVEGSKVTRVTNGHITIRYDDQHRAAPTAEQHSALAHDIGDIVRTYCPMQWKSWKAMPDEVRMKVCAQLSIADELQFRRINDNMLVSLLRRVARRILRTEKIIGRRKPTRAVTTRPEGTFDGNVN